MMKHVLLFSPLKLEKKEFKLQKFAYLKIVFKFRKYNVNWPEYWKLIRNEDEYCVRNQQRNLFLTFLQLSLYLSYSSVLSYIN